MQLQIDTFRYIPSNRGVGAVFHCGKSQLTAALVLSDHYISQLKRTLDLRTHGYYEYIEFNADNYLPFYRTILALLYEKAKSDRAWAKRYLLDSAKA
jgi:hypothetical protein